MENPSIALKCSVFDWLLLDFEFSRTINNQSEAKKRLLSYVIGMECFGSRLMRGKS